MSLDSFESRLARWAARLSDLQNRWRWLGRLVMIGAVGYAAVIVVVGGTQLSGLDGRWLLMASTISVGLYLGSVIAQVIVWCRIMAPHRSIGRADILIYGKGMVLRHLPGGVWHWFGRAAMYKSESNLRTTLTMVTNFVEWITLILVGLGIHGLINSGFWLIIGIVSIAAAVGIPWGYLISSRRQRRWIDIPIYLVESLIWITLYAVAWVLGGVILYVLSQFALPSQFDLITAISIWSLAGSVSLLAIIVPAGLGIREVSLSLLLQSYMPLNAALLTAVLIRIIFTLSDLIWGGGIWALLSNLWILRFVRKRLPYAK